MRAAGLLAVASLCGGCDVFLPDVWVDEREGLMWQRTPNEEAVDPKEAEDYCGDLIEYGENDWRVPDIDELRSLMRGCSLVMCGVATDCADSSTLGSCFDFEDCGGCYDKEGPGEEGCYTDAALAGGCTRANWSSTRVDDSSDDYYWTVNLSTGEVGYRAGDDRNGVIRCVRSVD